MIPDVCTIIKINSPLLCSALLSSLPSASLSVSFFKSLHFPLCPFPPHTSVQHGTYLKLQPVSTSFFFLSSPRWLDISVRLTDKVAPLPSRPLRLPPAQLILFCSLSAVRGTLCHRALMFRDCPLSRLLVLPLLVLDNPPHTHTHTLTLTHSQLHAFFPPGRWQQLLFMATVLFFSARRITQPILWPCSSLALL